MTPVKTVPKQLQIVSHSWAPTTPRNGIKRANSLDPRIASSEPSASALPLFAPASTAARAQLFWVVRTMVLYRCLCNWVSRGSF